MNLRRLVHNTYFKLFCAGALANLSFAPLFILPCMVISYIWFYKIFSNNTSQITKTNFLLGYSYGLGYFLFGLYWIALSLHINWPYFWWLFPFCVIAAPMLLSLFFGCVTLLTGWITKHSSPILTLLAFSTLWSLTEFIRGNIITEFPWLNIAETTLNMDAIPQILSIVGVYGLGLIILLCYALIYMAIFLHTKYRYSSIALLIMVISSIIIYGNNQLTNKTEFHPNLELVIVQPNISQLDKHNSKIIKNNIDILIDLSKQTSNKHTRIIIWPEYSIPLPLNINKMVRKYITNYLNDTDILITGAAKYHMSKMYNSLYALNNQGDILSTYDKIKLVPFGEYVPFKSIISNIIRGIATEQTDYSSGTTNQKISINNIPVFQPLICYEAIFPDHMLRNNVKKIEWLLNITNDGWFLNSSGPYQHLYITKIRAIEQRKPLVRSVYKGISAVFDPYGRLMKQIPINNKGTIITKLPKAGQKSIFSTHRHLLYFILVAIVTILMLNLYAISKNEDQRKNER